jgi:hypothetical protein
MNASAAFTLPRNRDLSRLRKFRLRKSGKPDLREGEDEVERSFASIASRVELVRASG